MKRVRIDLLVLQKQGNKKYFGMTIQKVLHDIVYKSLLLSLATLLNYNNLLE